MSSQPRHALWLGAEINTVDGASRTNPLGMWDLPIGQLLAQLLAVVCGNGVILLTKAAAGRLQLPCDGAELPRGDDAKGHPVAAVLRAAGWHVREVSFWFKVSHPQHGTAWIGLEEYLDIEHFVVADDPEPMTAALAAWHKLTGTPWHGGAGDAGNAILRQQRYASNRKQIPGEWWSWDGPLLGNPADLVVPIETPYLPGQWHRASPGSQRAVGIDRVRAYLSAMTCTDVAGQALKHDGRTAFDGSRCGWWLVDLGPWLFADMLPDPAGYGPGVDDDHPRRRWLTSPRVRLLTELAAHGEYEFEILDSWTARKAPLIKDYAKILRETWDATKSIDDPQVRKLVRAGVKGAYSLGHGYMRSRQSEVQRPDWAAAITAQSAANLWRAMRKIIDNGGDMRGPWPLWIDTDTVVYPDDYPHIDGLTIWAGDLPDLDDRTQLGHWRTTREYQLDPATGYPIRVSRETTQEAHA